MQRFRAVPHALISCLVLGMSCVLSVCNADERTDHFETKIRPVLVKHCIQCHGDKKAESDLRLDSREHAFADIETIELLEAIRYEGLEMPPDGQLPSDVIRDFEQWIADGAAWPEDAELRVENGISEEDRQWWAFQPLMQTEPPQSASLRAGTDTWATWASNPVDQFVLAQLHSRGMTPAPKADPATLLRRLYFTTIGLPPAPEDVERFLADPSTSAFKREVDLLLDDPRYGEHWARFWLDLVRYSESDGWNQDAYRPHIWRYRDYVMNSFNKDKPYAQFVIEQLAGDETGEDNPEHKVATGFLRLGIYEYNQRDARGHWNDIMNEMTDVAGDVFLGLSMACARCHDHKFDPIPQTDYFQLRACFEPVVWRDDQVAATQAEIEQHEAESKAWREATAEVRAKIDQLIEPYHAKKWISTVDKFPLDIQACYHMPIAERTSWQHQMAYLVIRQFEEEGGGPLKNMSKEDKERYEQLQKELATLDKLKPKPLPRAMTASDFGGLVSPTVLQDDPQRRQVGPGSLSVMAPDAGNALAVEEREQSTGRRIALANWITDPNNPLTYRVIVNRVWQHHFGEGLVRTPSDFGTQGALPSHPELLDWLTQSFIDQGGKFKNLHRMILLSSTWQQASDHPRVAEYQELDPRDELLWRAPVRRLRAEQIRDAMLAASRELDSKCGGPSAEESSKRRSLYIKSFRNKNDRFLDGFDVANGLKSVAVRDTTTTPTQALLMLNGTYARQRADAMAKRLLADSQDPVEILNQAFLRTWSHPPTEAQLQQAIEFLNVSIGEDSQPLDESKLSEFCHVLFNANPFLYLQ